MWLSTLSDMSYLTPKRRARCINSIVWSINSNPFALLRNGCNKTEKGLLLGHEKTPPDLAGLVILAVCLFFFLLSRATGSQRDALERGVALRVDEPLEFYGDTFADWQSRGLDENSGVAQENRGSSKVTPAHF